MRRDPIVEEVHRVRAAYAARFKFDLAALIGDLKTRQERGEFEVVYGVPRKPRRPLRRPGPRRAQGR
ncbi:MAG: hypothetical protein HY695_24025 [Deltaproteobacteria bacterium]|nr:hypothetical protein [Deltaproteobacteria bacterium]